MWMRKWSKKPTVCCWWEWKLIQGCSFLSGTFGDRISEFSTCEVLGKNCQCSNNIQNFKDNQNTFNPLYPQWSVSPLLVLRSQPSTVFSELGLHLTLWKYQPTDLLSSSSLCQLVLYFTPTFLSLSLQLKSFLPVGSRIIIQKEYILFPLEMLLTFRNVIGKHKTKNIYNYLLNAHSES